MFYFRSMDDRNRIWLRGPWHFDKSLIVLEKPEGSGDISKLGFNKVDIWVQIHNIPIMCMNRNTTKWLVEQISERVREILADSKECWGKFIQVKVQIDIQKPLKRWLRLKPDKTDNIVVVALKYERLPEFCFVCGKIGHGIRDCLDEEARTTALDGSVTRYEAWLRAPDIQKLKFRFQHQEKWDSSERGRATEGPPVVTRELSIHSKAKSQSSKGQGPASKAVTGMKTIGQTIQEILGQHVVGGPMQSLAGPEIVDSMSVDGPSQRFVDTTTKLDSKDIIVSPGLYPEPFSQECSGPVISKGLGCEGDVGMAGTVMPLVNKIIPMVYETPINKSTKKWKRIARECQSQPISGKITSPLQKLLSFSQTMRKISKKINPSAKGRSPCRKHRANNMVSTSLISGTDHMVPPFSSSSVGVGSQPCKRKVVFVSPEEVRDPKKSKIPTDGEAMVLSAEPGVQARREQ
ncbi:hypothetical protein Dsin_018908 [Dipteronia sinensis]|uniref:CCHC-type domain-containing protein n=1 Tax=Dipteronia sinensis TaxID=43782 RepID=A0AAE0A6R2_9ROSI|nr:hypothetical protein Dsin_018908 [Dipteronia sinensis]